MRTTLTIDDDILATLEREAEAKRVSFKSLVNSTLRRGLAAEALAAPARRVTLKPFAGGLLPGIDPDRLNQLNDELETEAFRKKIGSKNKPR